MQHQILIDTHLFLLTKMMPFRHGAVALGWAKETGQARTGQAGRALLNKTGGKIDNLTTTTATPNTSQQKNKMCLDEEPKTAA